MRWEGSPVVTEPEPQVSFLALGLSLKGPLCFVSLGFPEPGDMGKRPCTFFTAEPPEWRVNWTHCPQDDRLVQFSFNIWTIRVEEILTFLREQSIYLKVPFTQIG